MIELSEEDYNCIDDCILGVYGDAIKNGVVFPNEYGDLIDRDICLSMKAYDLVGEYGIPIIAVPTEDIVRMKPVIPGNRGLIE